MSDWVFGRHEMGPRSLAFTGRGLQPRTVQEMNTLGPGAAGLLLVAGAGWGLVAGASRPQGVNQGLSALAGTLLAPLLVPPAAMLAFLVGLLDDGARPVPLGLAIAACVVVGGAMSALAHVSPSLSGLAFAGGAYLVLRIFFGPDPVDGFVQPVAGVAAGVGVWSAMGFGAHRLLPASLTAALGPVAVAQAMVAASRIAGGVAVGPHIAGQVIGACVGAAMVAGVYLLREAARRKSRKLRPRAARAAQ